MCKMVARAPLRPRTGVRALGWSMWGRLPAGGLLAGDDEPDRPHLAHELAGDGRLGNVGLLARAHEVPVAPAVPVVALRGLGLDRRGDLAPLALALPRAVVVGQARQPLDHGAPHRGVAGLGDAAVAADPLAAVAPARGEPEVARDAAPVGEPGEVVDGGGEGEGHDVVDALQPGQGVDVGLPPGLQAQLEEALPELAAPVDRRDGRLDVGLQGPLGAPLRQPDGPGPVDVVAGPRGAEPAGGGPLVPDVAVPQQHARGLHLQRLRGPDLVEVGADRVAGALCLLGGHVDRPAAARRGGHGLEQAARVAPVVLERPVVGALRDARDGDHVAGVAEGPEVAAELEAARARLVHEADRPGRPRLRPPGYPRGGRAVGEPGAPRLPGGEVDGGQGDGPGVLVDRHDGGVLCPQGVLLHLKGPFPCVRYRVPLVCSAASSLYPGSPRPAGWGPVFRLVSGR